MKWDEYVRHAQVVWRLTFGAVERIQLTWLGLQRSKVTLRLFGQQPSLISTRKGFLIRGCRTDCGRKAKCGVPSVEVSK